MAALQPSSFKSYCPQRSAATNVLHSNLDVSDYHFVCHLSLVPPSRQRELAMRCISPFQKRHPCFSNKAMILACDQLTVITRRTIRTLLFSRHTRNPLFGRSLGRVCRSRASPFSPLSSLLTFSHLFLLTFEFLPPLFLLRSYQNGAPLVGDDNIPAPCVP